jgi:uncharacterized caspase-like protein
MKYNIVGSVLLPIASFTCPAHAEKRFALVVGNSAYRIVTPLHNLAKDAASMATLFKEAGFDTVALENNVVDFKRAIRDFEDTAIDSDIAIVFYTGHGIEIGGPNYLVPVDGGIAEVAIQGREVRF